MHKHASLVILSVFVEPRVRYSAGQTDAIEFAQIYLADSRH